MLAWKCPIAWLHFLLFLSYSVLSLSEWSTHSPVRYGRPELSQFVGLLLGRHCWFLPVADRHTIHGCAKGRVSRNSLLIWGGPVAGWNYFLADTLQIRSLFCRDRFLPVADRHTIHGCAEGRVSRAPLFNFWRVSRIPRLIWAGKSHLGTLFELHRRNLDQGLPTGNIKYGIVTYWFVNK